MFNKEIDFIKKLYHNKSIINLHEPAFLGNEKEYLNNCIDSTFVSYLGEYVTYFEKMIAEFVGVDHAVAFVNGTSALHIALKVAGVGASEEVITQSLSFVATANAIKYTGADPVFVDVDLASLGMSSESLRNWLAQNTYKEEINNLEENKNQTRCFNKSTKKRISAIIPMHTFGFPCDIEEIVKIGVEFNIPVIEDSAEALGSFIGDKHLGIYGKAGVLSFNGNKTITTGGGGMLITNDAYFAERAKHLSTTAKVAHPWEFVHNEVGYNYRMPNINAAIGVAQMEKISEILKNKKETAESYYNHFNNTEVECYFGNSNMNPNYWLNTIKFENESLRTRFLTETNANGIKTRPIWNLLSELPMYQGCQRGELINSNILEKTLVNLPSGFRS